MLRRSFSTNSFAMETQLCANTISSFFHHLDNGNVKGVVDLFDEEAIVFLQMANETTLLIGHDAIASWGAHLHEKFKGATHWESNMIIEKNESSFTNKSYWQSRNGSEVLSYGTHDDIFIIKDDKAKFLYRGVSVNWTQSNGHANLPSTSDFATFLYESKLKWSSSWSGVSSDNPKWTRNQEESTSAQKELFKRHNLTSTPLRVFAPLCGNAPILHTLFEEGHDVIGIDLSLYALQSLFSNIDPSIPLERGVQTLKTTSGVAKVPSLVVQQKGKPGRLQGICSDVFFRFEDEKEVAFDLLFDKDALGALPFAIHEKYAELMSSRVRSGGYIYIEAKYRHKEEEQMNGPPYHITKEYLQTLYPTCQLVEMVTNPFGEVYKEYGMDHNGYLLKKQ